MTGLREMLQICGQEELLAQLRRLSPKNYEDFVDVLNEDLEQLIGLIESDARDFMKTGEDFMNREIVRLLRARCYIASHDHDEGGHVDVRVQSRDGKYSWLAEAKLDNGPAYLEKGIHQLTERYVKGTPGHNSGAFIIYFMKDRCSERFKEWREHLESASAGFEELTFDDCPNRIGLSFYTEMILPRLGFGAPKYRIRHLAVSVHRPASVQ